MKLRHLFFGIVTCTAFASFCPVQAGETYKEYKTTKEVLESEFPFEKGAHEVQVGAGAFLPILSPGSETRPRITYALGSVRHGWMLTDVSGDGCLRGNWEFLVDIYGGGVVEGPGGILTGLSVLIRYNFVKEHGTRFIPYVQLGGGGLYNTVYENQPQRVIGGAFEFNLEASVGFRYMFNDRWAFFMDGGYRHISNAGLSARNTGLNSLGAIAGVSYFY